MRSRLLGGAVLAGLLAVAGCGGKGTVSGLVAVGGKPAVGGAVAFHPVGSGPSATGEIGKDGRYTLAVGNERALPPGEYKVTVVVYAESPPWDNTKGAPPAPKLLSDVKYGDVATTPITKTVTAGGNEINLDVDPAVGK